tara:strand:+ start:21 stop:578 length:558 start_codon:yes stop_codon:yes gene_type:complete
MNKFEKLQMFYKKLSPTTAGLIGAGLGWGFSDTLVDAPRGNMTPQQQREWERLIERAMKRQDARRMRKEVSLEKGNPRLQVPPESGRVFDPVKHRWTNPANVGEKVKRKRIRASGVGAHQRSLAVGRIGGKDTGQGAGSAEAGRRFKSKIDVKEQLRNIKSGSKKTALGRFLQEHKKGKKPSSKK